VVTKRMVCLANSRKLSGRCIAGKEMRRGKPSGWLRPVSAREHEEVSEYERQYEDGSDPTVLDVIDLQLIEPRPKGYQQENWLLDAQTYWAKVGQITWNDLATLQDPAAPLWIDGHRTYSGLNDQIPLALATGLTTSLRLIRVDELTLRVFKPGEAFGNNKRRVQGKFEHHGIEYRLWVTDPRYERAFLLKTDGEYKVGECYLTVSLGEAFNNVCYKLIAAIIEP
jgi:Dual OB-containing domain